MSFRTAVVFVIATALTPAVGTWAHTGAAGVRSSPLQVDADGFVFVVNPDSDSVTRLTPLSAGTQGVQ